MSFKYLGPNPSAPIGDVKLEVSLTPLLEALGKGSSDVVSALEVIAERLGEVAEATRQIKPGVINVQPTPIEFRPDIRVEAACPDIRIEPSKLEPSIIPHVTIEARPGKQDFQAQLSVNRWVIVAMLLVLLLQTATLAFLAFKQFQGGN